MSQPNKGVVVDIASNISEFNVYMLAWFYDLKGTLHEVTMRK